MDEPPRLKPVRLTYEDRDDTHTSYQAGSTIHINQHGMFSIITMGWAVFPIFITT
jgi:hypothetical protein